MKINYEKTELFIERLDSTLKELENTQESLKNERIRLSQNTGTDSVIAQIKRTEKRIEEQMMFIIRSKQALQKIMEVYSVGEEKIKTVIESGQTASKQSFKDSSYIYDNTGFDWSII